MEIMGVYPKELHVKIELSETDLNYLLDYLNSCTAELNLSTEEGKKCDEFVTKEFFPSLNALCEEMKRMR